MLQHTARIAFIMQETRRKSSAVSRGTLEVMCREMQLAHAAVKAALDSGSNGWDALFAEPNFVVAHGKYLAVGTSAGRLKVYDVSRGREPKEIGSGGS